MGRGSDGQASPVARGLVVLFTWDIMMLGCLLAWLCDDIITMCAMSWRGCEYSYRKYMVVLYAPNVIVMLAVGSGL